MKVEFALWLLSFGAVFGYPSLINFKEEERWNVPLADGSSKYMSEVEAQNEFSGDRVPDEPIYYNLFTKKNPQEAQVLLMDDPKALQQSNFNPKNPTRVVVHGWLLGNYSSGLTTLIMDAFLGDSNKDEYNLFIVDWANYAQNINYAEARYDAPKAGKEMAEFIDFLNENAGMPFETLTLIGHSLGGQVVGIIGKNVKRGKVNTIMALDPAGPLFGLSKCSSRLCIGDAEYIEVIHTDCGELGYAKPLGNSDFYPNWGQTQPGCGWDLAGTCSHSRAIELYAEAIRLGSKNQFFTWSCPAGYDNVKVESGCSARDEGIKMGDPKNYKRASGVYYLATREESPFGIGYDQILY